VPFAADQFFWADRLRQLGVSSGAVSAGHLRASSLARSIAFAESSAARSQARALRERMAAEDGLAEARAVIEALMSMER
jgi:sterol 3beta-glucosyltransferase